MSFMPIMLWSDALVFLLLSSGIATAWYIRQREHLLLPWRRVAQSATAMVSLLVLSLFLILGSGVWIGLTLSGVAWIGMQLFSSRPAGDAMAVTIWGSASSWTLTALPRTTQAEVL